MTGETYSIDVAQVATVTSSTSKWLDDLSSSVTRSIAALDAALAAVGGEPAVQGALADVSEGRRETGTAMLTRAGRVIATVQGNALLYTATDGEMASTTTAAADASSASDSSTRGWR